MNLAAAPAQPGGTGYTSRPPASRVAAQPRAPSRTGNAPARPTARRRRLVTGLAVASLVILVVLAGSVGSSLLGLGARPSAAGPTGPAGTSIAAATPVATVQASPATAGPSATPDPSPTATAAGPIATPPPSPPTSPAASASGPARLGVTARASSVLDGSSQWVASHAVDGDPLTAWLEGHPIEVGQWIELEFPAFERLDAIVIWNGNQASPDAYAGTRRLANILIRLDDQSPTSVRLGDTPQSQEIDLGGVSGVRRIRIEIVSTYDASATSLAGSPLDAAAISEIELRGLP